MAKLNIYHLFATALVLISSRRRKREKKLKKKRKAFLDPTFICSQRNQRCLSQLSTKNERNRQNFGLARISPNRFDNLLELIKPITMRKNAVRAPDEHLAIARFLASGESRESNCKIGKAIVCGIVEDVCEAI